jgi:UDP-glucuronate decarboxylase
MINAQHIINTDLEYIAEKLSSEFLQMSGKKLLITGGAGFLGHYLVQSVLHWNRIRNSDEKIHVTVYDNYIRGIPQWLLNLKENTCLDLLKYNVVDPLPERIDDFHYIIHAASIASPIYYRAHPIETMDANVNGLRNLLEYCRQQKVKSTPVEGFLFFSSSEIYGAPDPANIPTPETYRGNVSCTGPRACYDEAKRYGETLCVNFTHHYGLPIKVARPFNNYGPGLKITDRRVIPDFVRDILTGKDIVLLSDGSATRTFCYVADAIVGYYKILVSGKDGHAYNIGVEEPEISIAELAERMVGLAGKLFGYQNKLAYHTSADRDYLVDNPNRRCPVITKARDELGYHPAISLDDGLERSLIWYNDNREAEDA